MKTKFEALDLIIYVLWALIIIFILLNLCFDSENFILVGLAGLLASASVMKNIENTNKIEKEKIKRELFKQRAEIIFTIENMTNIINEDLHISTIDNISKIIKESTEKIIYAEYIFEKKDFKYIKPILEASIKYKNLKDLELIDRRNPTEIYANEMELKKEIVNSSKNISDNLKDSVKLV
ncbi:putative membrane protein [Aliarcobacter faecis]|uniref:hypothetical protein n=1 Tax=Aliarcobacter faecis TaxID=1564138 RepID=UPI00047EFAD7|nr:hypothetical protein [Aliarcobacter faecis]QKF72748.1 putative membrane protein [Aliarcobacter faecis]